MEVTLKKELLAHDVHIVCARHDDRKSGLAVAWVTQVADDVVLVCIGKQSYTRELLLAAGSFSLNVLRSDQVAVGRAFGLRSGRDVDKFADVAYHTGQTGSPLLDDCARTYDCSVEQVLDYGDIKMIFGKIVASERRNDPYEPLIMMGKDYWG